MVQWLRSEFPPQGARVGSLVGELVETPHAAWCSQKNKIKREKERHRMQQEPREAADYLTGMIS